jgi:hypothetical protein
LVLPVRDWVIATPDAVAVTAHVYRYAVAYEETTMDCRSVHVPVPVHVGAPRVSTESSENASKTIRSPLLTLNVGDVLVVVPSVQPRAGVTPRTRVGAVAIAAP